MDCELNKPMCKRKATVMEGPFVKNKPCPLTKKQKCPVAPPHCPLLPEPENDCPVRRLFGTNNNTNTNQSTRESFQTCPLSQPGCPCDPSPPCPLEFDEDDNNNKEETNGGVTEKVKCPTTYPNFGNCSKTINKKNLPAKMSPCPKVFDGTLTLDNNIAKDVEEISESQENNGGSKCCCCCCCKPPKPCPKPSPKTCSTPSSKTGKSKSSRKNGVKVALNVPGCTLSSTRPLPCAECLQDMLMTVGKKWSNPKDCSYLKIMNVCPEDCTCDAVPPVESGPPCPFAPKPCPCCAAARCPLTRVPDCSLVSGSKKSSPKSKSCKCLCPPLGPSHTLEVAPLCKMHDNLCPVPPKPCVCTCDEDEPPPPPPPPEPSCPMKQLCEVNNVKKEDCIAGPKKPIASVNTTVAEKELCVSVSPELLEILEDTLKELNKMCVCEQPPPPQRVTMVPFGPPPTVEPKPCTCCKKEENLGYCPLDCQCEPKRTFHVPTCPIKKPECLQTSPTTTNKGEKVCPVAPNCCPLGPECPFPVSTNGASNGMGEDPCSTKESLDDKVDRCAGVLLKNFRKEWKKREEGKNLESAEKTEDDVPQVEESPPLPLCPLSQLPETKKKPCPFSPAPCPLDLNKPPMEEPKPCPFAPEPACPYKPKPLCPPETRCNMKPSAPPNSECPYATPGCPQAPKKLCPPKEGVDYKCPCPKPKPCPCADIDPCCPCPDSEPECPCPPEPDCPCPDPEPTCPCPKPKPKCLIKSLTTEKKSSCPCPKPMPKCPSTEDKKSKSPCPKPMPKCPSTEDKKSKCPCPKPMPKCPSTEDKKSKCPCSNKEIQCPCSALYSKCPRSG